jgi:hypothetical protein
MFDFPQRKLSLCLEKHILALETSNEKFDSSDRDLEDHALELAIEETYNASGQKWKPWASNPRALRVGDIILLVDSDTIVPEVCCPILYYTLFLLLTPNTHRLPGLLERRSS